MDLLKELLTSATMGLDPKEAELRKLRFGANVLRQQEPVKLWMIAWQQLKSLIVLLLVLAAGVSFFLGEWIECYAILAVLVVNTFIGFMMEFRAVRSMEALRKMGRTEATVMRGGEAVQVNAEDLVPGDIVLYEGGDIIAADMRILEASRLSVDESALTGESVPIDKVCGELQGEVPLAERVNMLFKGTAVTNGSGKGLVLTTGMSTELGHIAKLTYEAEDEVTPLEKRLDKLGQRLALISIGLVILIGIMGLWSGKDLVLMFETAIALAVATIPEGLPIVATIALAKGMRAMAKRNALINRLSAVETLGATTVILSDKTGTLTENRMTVGCYSTGEGRFEVRKGLEAQKGVFYQSDSEVDVSDRSSLQLALKVGVLCSNASLGNGTDHQDLGDPMEIALLQAGKMAGFERESLLMVYPEIQEEAFDPQTRMMATLHRDHGKVFVAVKGAPESIIEAANRRKLGDNIVEMTEEDRQSLMRENESLASGGFRILGLGYKVAESEKESPYSEIVFVGLVGLLDPPRKGVKEAVAACHDAGIRVSMVTGDQAATARSIGAQIGLAPDEIFSRVSPQDKLDIVRDFQEGGAVVAMTGDGVNDAPALKKADIGIAMGERGTQVAREAADMVLKDDNFVTIVAAIQQGRVVFSNIRRFVVYLLSCNISEVLVVSVAAALNAPLPITPLQILFLNLVTDVFPALALGMGEGDNSYLKNSPRNPEEAMLTPKHWWTIGVYGLLITICVFAAFGGAIQLFAANNQKAVTISFLTIAFAQVFHVFNMRDDKAPLLSNDVVRNPHVWGAVVFCGAILVASIWLEPLRRVLELVALDPLEWLWVFGWSLAPLIVVQIFKEVRR